jgi:hypothetical protein
MVLFARAADRVVDVVTFVVAHTAKTKAVNSYLMVGRAVQMEQLA